MDIKIPKTPFSLPFEPRRGLLTARIRAIAEGRGKRRSRLAAGLYLLITVLCVNLVSCAKAEAEPSLIPAVLAGEQEYYSRIYGGFLDLEHLSQAEIPDYPEVETDLPCYISDFAAVDLDGDGAKEGLLAFAYDTYGSDRIAIFHQRDGQVYVDFTNYRSINPGTLYTDGTTIMSGASYLHYISKITSFTDNGKAVFETIATIDGSDWSINGKVYASESKFLTAQDELLEGKTHAEWYPYEGADFSAYFD